LTPDLSGVATGISPFQRQHFLILSGQLRM
jgi:hypothetical protein